MDDYPPTKWFISNPCFWYNLLKCFIIVFISLTNWKIFLKKRKNSRFLSIKRRKPAPEQETSKKSNALTLKRDLDIAISTTRPKRAWKLCKKSNGLSCGSFESVFAMQGWFLDKNWLKLFFFLKNNSFNSLYYNLFRCKWYKN